METCASNPGNVRINFARFLWADLKDTIILVVVSVVCAFIYPQEPRVAYIIGGIGLFVVLYGLYQANSLFREGDACPGIVLDPASGSIAVLADLSTTSNPHYVVSIKKVGLSRSSGGPYKVGSRVPYIAFYNGSSSDRRWRGFGGHIVQAGTNSKKTIKRVILSIDDEEWQVLKAAAKRIPLPYRSKTYTLAQLKKRDIQATGHFDPAWLNSIKTLLRLAIAASVAYLFFHFDLWPLIVGGWAVVGIVGLVAGIVWHVAAFPEDANASPWDEMLTRFKLKKPKKKKNRLGGATSDPIPLSVSLMALEPLLASVVLFFYIAPKQLEQQIKQQKQQAQQVQQKQQAAPQAAKRKANNAARQQLDMAFNDFDKVMTVIMPNEFFFTSELERFLRKRDIEYRENRDGFPSFEDPNKEIKVLWEQDPEELGTLINEEFGYPELEVVTTGRAVWMTFTKFNPVFNSSEDAYWPEGGIPQNSVADEIRRKIKFKIKTLGGLDKVLFLVLEKEGRYSSLRFLIRNNLPGVSTSNFSRSEDNFEICIVQWDREPQEFVDALSAPNEATIEGERVIRYGK
ncbi:DUF3239 domain-containing protein [Calycomorphotria hydatis]|uniref:Uncharacterized protein n=1 Tax=Calycomorphotria hydatis TaxID=2528027 RepID=A0A517T3Z5_9PLAN|nr:DUF3239 domain-containing protein [Calycomorphotria hydatis]QDT63071.1 hypothetical protein V22_02710 [Calycomorphotria hydatis]